MSNYTPSSGWAGKDALSDSDPSKVISGAEFATEFGLIQTAVNTKANLNGSATETFSAVKAASGTDTTQVATTSFVQGEKVSPTFTGTPLAPTASAATNNTQIATTAYVTTAVGDRTVSTSAPSGGSDGDIWYRY